MILVFWSRGHPPAVIYTQIVKIHQISAKIHKSEAIYFLISNDAIFNAIKMPRNQFEVDVATCVAIDVAYALLPVQ